MTENDTPVRVRVKINPAHLGSSPGPARPPKAGPEKAAPGPTVGDYIPPPLEDPSLDKAIDDIIVSESNEVLAAEDRMGSLSGDAKTKKKRQFSFKKIFKNKWLYIGLGVVIVILMALPYSRYYILGQFLTNKYPVTILDSVTNQPVSGALVTSGGHKFTTNAEGLATLKLPLGQQSFKVTKGYYSSLEGHIFVGFKKSSGETIYLIATGRRVNITIENKLTLRPLSGVHISILNTSATTGSSGQTQIVLPTKQYTYEATFSAAGFNSVTTPINVTASKTANIIKLVPSGYIYYLSNSTGTVDVIKANLDGSNPTIELAGTGSESSSTALLPSPDWKYLVLEAQRSTSQPELYIINTANGNLDEFDSAADSFKLIGWSGDQFIYDEVAASSGSSANEQIKSYNAINGTLNVLDQNQVDGSSPSYAYQSFGSFELLPSQLLYITSWTSIGSYDISTLNDTIRGVEPNGLNKKDYSTYQASTTGQMSIVRSSPSSFYFSVPNTSTGQTSYYQFMSGSITSADSSAFTATYPNYLLSPSAEATLWQTGSIIYSGNQTGGNGKKISLPDGYNLVGWYDNIYILLSRGNQLYISPLSGSNDPYFVGSVMSQDVL